MKTRITSRMFQITFLAIAALASCLASGIANAQTQVPALTSFKGTFTLPYEARLGTAVLPPGSYTISVDISGDALVREKKSQNAVVHLFFQGREDAGHGGNALLIGGQGHQRIVYSVRVADLGTTFISDPTLAHPQHYREEVRQTQTVPVLQAKK